MADNYLEKRYEEVFSGKSSKYHRTNTKSHPSLDTLLLKNRSFRGYDQTHIVTTKELTEIVKVNNKIPSARNQQVLRFKLVTKGEEAEKIQKNIRLGGALPQLHLPFPGTAPEAFIIVCSTVPETKWVDIDLGISAQSMLLKAVEMGLAGICILAFNKAEIIRLFDLKYEPVLIIAIGRGNEKIQLLSIGENESHDYYRDAGIHYVPKVKVEDLIL